MNEGQENSQLYSKHFQLHSLTCSLNSKTCLQVLLLPLRISPIILIIHARTVHFFQQYLYLIRILLIML